MPALVLTAAMVLVPPAFLTAVRVSAPAEVRLRSAAAAPSSAAHSDAMAAADRLSRYAGAGRSSRSDAQLRIFTRANQDATTTTTEAPTTTAETTSTTSTTVKAKPVTTTTTRAKAAAQPAEPPTTTAKPTTTTTAGASRTSTTGSPPPCCRQEGGASYHDYSDPRTCAHRTLAKGTAVRVTNLANGKRTTCVVNDRGPYVEGRIIDLSTTAFREIANISDGVIRVALEW